MSEWECSKDCKKLEIYGWGCPDDLLGDEPCPLAIWPDDINDKKGSDKQMNFKDMWNKSAKQEKKQFGDLPEGTYKAKVMACKFESAKNLTADPTKTNCVWDLQVVDGEQKNNHIWVYRSFSKQDTSEQNQKAIDRVLNDFIQLGLPADTDVIGKTMIDVVGKTIEIKLKSDGKDGQYKNFMRVIDEVPVVAAEIVPDKDPFGNDYEKPF